MTSGAGLAQSFISIYLDTGIWTKPYLSLAALVSLAPV